MDSIALRDYGSKKDPSRRRIRVLFGIICGLLLSLACLAYWLYSGYQENRELEARLLKERRALAEAQETINRYQELRSSQKPSAGAGAAGAVSGLVGGGAGGGPGLSGLFGRKDAAATPRQFSDPVWNAWVEPSSSNPLFDPQHLRAGQDYSFVINLAALAYDEDKLSKDAGVYSQPGGSTFAEWLDKNKTIAQRDVKVLVIPDPLYFATQLDTEVMKPYTIDLEKMRRVQSHGFTLQESALEYLKENHGKADFSFGIKSFQIKPIKSGLGWIAVSIWADGMPVSEFSYPACIVDFHKPCDIPTFPPSTLKGVDLTKLDRQPDAALQIIDRRADVVGVFRCNSCGWRDGDFKVWDVAQNADEFVRGITRVLKRLGNIPQPKLASNERYTAELHATSEALYNDIFGVPSNKDLPTEREQKAIVAQTAFQGFLLTSLQREKDGKAPLSLFARLIPSEPELVLTPVGLLEIKSAGTRAADTAANTQDDYPDFAGFYLNIQAPLQLQDYSVSSKCLSRWVMLVPPESLPDDETTDYEAVRLARTDFAKWIDRFRRSCQDCVKDDSRLEHFQQWLQGAGADADAVIALSHHDDDFGLFFDASNRSPAIVPDDIHRAFDYPSVAILAACGTAEPGGSDFVEAFNKKQIKTVIATSTAVAPEMAGRFLSILMDLLDDPANGPSYSLSQARFEAVRKLSKATDALGIPFGGRALEFILAGNGSLRVCPPKDSPLPAKASN